jgi:hypothetical protein
MVAPDNETAKGLLGGGQKLDNRRLAYVVVSRGRYDAQIYTNDKTSPAEGLGRDVSHPSALESTRAAEPPVAQRTEPTFALMSCASSTAANLSRKQSLAVIFDSSTLSRAAVGRRFAPSLCMPVNNRPLSLRARTPPLRKNLHTSHFTLLQAPLPATTLCS